jgi:hypothetical protein
MLQKPFGLLLHHLVLREASGVFGNIHDITVASACVSHVAKAEGPAAILVTGKFGY